MSGTLGPLTRSRRREDSVRTWHDLRHTFGSRLIMSGVDLKTAQTLMGHKTISMTARYAHLSSAHLDAAVDRLEG